jgi:hypothetical protein
MIVYRRIQLAIKWNIDLVRQFVEENGDGDKLISDVYKNSNTKLKYRCNACDSEYSIDWNSFIKGYRHYLCPDNKDRGKGKRTPYAEVKDYYENNGYILVSEAYRNQNEKLETICPNNHTYFSRFSDFKQGNRCPICFHAQKNINQTFKLDYVKDYILMHGDGDFLVSEEYLGCKEKIKIFCHICKEEYSTNFDGFRRGNRCYTCSYAKGMKERTERAISNGHNLGEENPDLLLEWDWDKNIINPYRVCSSSKLSAFWLCPKCEKSYEARIGHRAGKSKSGCPFCNLSKGEIKIKVCLENFKVDYIPQYKFKDCKHKKILPFDFYLTKYNVCLEFSGQQHFYSIDHFGGDKAFEIQKIRDNIKKDYCENNNIPLIIIPYWEYDNIETILAKELNL